MPNRILTFLVLFSCSSIAANNASAQTNPPIANNPPEEPVKPSINLFEHGWGATGELVLAFRIKAGSEPLEMGKIESDSTGEETGSTAFSMTQSRLLDLTTNQKLTPLPRNLKKPYYGPSSTLLTLQPKAWIQLGICFPKPADPGKDARGNALPYKFVFYPENGLEPITIQIPQPLK